MAEQVVSTHLTVTGVGKYQAQMAAAARSNARFGSTAGPAAAKASTLQGRMSRVASGAGLISPALLGAGGAVYAIKQVVDAAIDWESAFAGVEKTVEGTPAQLQEISDGLRDMSKEIPTSAEDLAGVAEAAGQLGIETAGVLEFTRTMADLGVATNMTADDAATAMARFANITQMPQEEFDRLGSVVVDLGNNMATTEDEIVEMGLRLAGAGDQAGLTEAEIMGMAGSLSSVGIRAQAGGTAFSKVMIEMTNAAESGGDKLQSFADVAGMSASEFATAFREDPAEAIIAFVEGLGTASDEGENLFAILDDLEITEIRMRDALLRTAGAGDVLGEAMGRSNQAWEDNNALTEEAERRYETTASQLSILGNNVKDAARDVGETLKPALDFVLADLNATFTEGSLGHSIVTGAWAIGSDILRPIMDASGYFRDWGVALGFVEEQVDSVGEATGLWNEYLQDVPDGFMGMRGPAMGARDVVEEVDTAFEGAAESTDDATEALENYIDGIKRATDPVYAVFSALDAVEDAQSEFNDAVGEHGPKSDEARAAAIRHASALDDLETAAINGELSFEEFEARLRRWQREGDLTAKEADHIRDRVKDARTEAQRFERTYTAEMSLKNWKETGDGINDLRAKAEKAERTYTMRWRQVGNMSIPSALGDGPGRGGAATARARAAIAAVPGRQYVTSTYRTPAQNARVGGSPTSYHLDRANPATDIGGDNLSAVYAYLARRGGNRELLGPGDPGHSDHVHVAHNGGEVTSDWPTMAGLRSDERPAVVQVGEYITPKGASPQMSAAAGTVVNNHVSVQVAGSVVTERQLVETVRTGLSRTARRNGGRG